MDVNDEDMFFTGIDIKKDENGEFIVYSEHKIYLNDWIRITIDEFNQKIENKEWLTSENLCQTILTEGIDKIRFYFNYIVGRDGKRVEFHIEEGFNRKVHEDYKLKLVPNVNDNNSNFQVKNIDTIDLVKILMKKEAFICKV